MNVYLISDTHFNHKNIATYCQRRRDFTDMWWMEHGFDFACDGMKFRNMWLTHEPSTSLADGTQLNIHGHLHNIWNGFNSPEREERDRALLGTDYKRRLKNPWQRLFAIEYTDYRPVEFDKFVNHPEKYQATGPKPI